MRFRIENSLIVRTDFQVPFLQLEGIKLNFDSVSNILIIETKDLLIEYKKQKIETEFNLWAKKNKIETKDLNSIYFEFFIKELIKNKTNEN